MYPGNVKIFRYEDFVRDKPGFMETVSEFIDIPFSPTMLYPSWNGVEIKETIAPWGTVLKSTEAYNAQMIDELTEEEKVQIASATMALGRHFRYDQFSYLEKYYV